VVVLVAVAVAVVAPALKAEGQARGPGLKKGTEVILKSKEVSVRLGQKVVATGQEYRIYRVDRVADGRAWISAGKLRGWVKPAELLTLDQAIEVATALIERQPTATLHGHRGYLKLRLRDYDGAIADFDEVIRLDPKLAVGYNNRGQARIQKKEYDGALADFDEAIRLDPKLAVAHDGRGTAHLARHEYDAAIADFDAAVKLDPNFAQAYSDRAVAYYAQGENARALPDAEQAVRLDPSSTRAIQSRGAIRDELGDYAGALADFDAAIKLDPAFAVPYGARAWIWATCPVAKYRDGKKAVQSATRGCELGKWKDFNLLHELAAARAEAGDFDAAVKWVTKALELAPEQDASPKRLALLRECLDHYRAKKPFRTEPHPGRSPGGPGGSANPGH
jgi:tetratricopeptide (TPR) repeat protein